MRVLVLAQSYPDNNGCVELMYIHTRNMYYRENGIDVSVLNFKAQKSYIKDGIQVFSFSEFRESELLFDLLLIHAPNIRNHYRFLNMYGHRFPRFLFFFHGHEVMKINHDYAQPYPYMEKSAGKKVVQDIYDFLKLRIWKHYFPRVLGKSHFIFVSKWMLEIFIKNVGISLEKLKGKYSITYNSVGKDFETQNYDAANTKKYDFITVRANLNGSKYAVDIVNRLAHNTPSGKFLVVGKGQLFDHIQKADNITWIDSTMNHEQIIEVLNQSRFALMPTRTDAQGLMMCEMAAFGIPVITSDIAVCHEVFDGFGNVFFVDNDDLNANLNVFMTKRSTCVKDDRYYHDKTINCELLVIEQKVR